MQRVLVLGAKGMVGSALTGVASPPFDVIGLGHGELDITAERETFRTIQEIRPRIVIHAAAYTDVDGCEENPEKAFNTNSQGTLFVAQACRRVGARLVYLSTDYVFDGKCPKPYGEEARVNPISVYGRVKLEGERHVQRLLEAFVIVRTQWLFGEGGRNFVDTIMDLAKAGKPLKIVQDQIGSPTYTVDLSQAIFRLLEKGCHGIFHVANRTSCSWYDLAREVVRVSGISGAEIIPIQSVDLDRSAPRPEHSVLDCEKLTRETGLRMRTWQEALRAFIEGREMS